MLAFKNPLYSVESVRMVAREIVTLGECKELSRKLGREKKAILMVNSVALASRKMLLVQVPIMWSRSPSYFAPRESSPPFGRT